MSVVFKSKDFRVWVQYANEGVAVSIFQIYSQVTENKVAYTKKQITYLEMIQRIYLEELNLLEQAKCGKVELL